MDLRPMKAVTGTLPAAADTGWVYEVKWDGMRVLAHIDPQHRSVRLVTANGIDATPRFPELAGLVDAVEADAVLDGEIVAVNEAGRPDFGRLQYRMHIANPAEARRRAAEVPVTLVLFDLLCLDGRDAFPLPWRERRRLLDVLVEAGDRWQLSPVHDNGEVLLDAATERGLEGVMAKRADSPYQPGRRSPAWRKVKVRRRQEVVVGGWWPGEGNRAGGLGSLVVGVHDPTARGHPLRYAGKVGTGFTVATLSEYERLLAPLATDASPFDPPPPRLIARRAHWVRPEIVIEVEFGEWTSDGILRHPSHLGRRIDKDPADVIREPSPG